MQAHTQHSLKAALARGLALCGACVWGLSALSAAPYQGHNIYWLNTAASVQAAPHVVLAGVGMQSASAASSTALDTLFTIRGIHVDETAANASSARTQGLAGAEVEAFRRLVRKLTPEDARSRLPELSRSQISNYIRGIQINDEKISNRRYVAEVTVAFEPSLVSEFFAFHQVPHVFGAGGSLLVLKAHKVGTVVHMWQQTPVMAAADASVDWQNRLRQYSFASATLSDRIAFSPQQLEAMQASAALKLADTYGKSGALEIITEWQPAAQKMLYRAELVGGAAPVKVMGEIDASQSARAENAALQACTTARGGEAAFTDSALTLEACALTAAYETVLDAVDQDWRSKLLVDVSLSGKIPFYLPAETIEAWKASQLELKTLSLVEAMTLSKLQLPLSRFEVAYRGEVEQLLVAVRSLGYEVVPYSDGYFVKKLTTY